MGALQDWLDFKTSLAHPPTRDGFCAAWRQMSGREAPVAAVQQFGRTVLPLFMLACAETDGWDHDEIPPSMTAALGEAMKTGLLLGFKPSDYGYDIEIQKLKTPKERAH